jgi:tripartite-type tricarboxylate transporter receptor subunit TctC
MFSRFSYPALTLVCLALPAGSANASSEAVAAFYARNPMEMVIGYPPGGSNDSYARIVASRIGKYVPGEPKVIVRNMPGAGSLTAANHLFTTAPQNGSVLGAVSQGIPLQARLGHPQARYNPSEFNWVGRMSPSSNVTMVWHASKAFTFEDSRKMEITLGATGAGSTVSLYPSVMNEILGTKFKIIMGYKGSPDAMLAMERGEVESHSTTWELVKSIRPDWLKEGKIRILVQHGLTRNAELPNVPTSIELTKDPKDKDVMKVIMSAAEVGKSYFTTPNVPAERVEALRRAFDKMIIDKDFIEDVKRIRGEIGPLKGEELQKMIADLDDISPDVIARVKAVYNEK